MERTRFQEHLRRQIGYIRVSAAQYDAGNTDEGIRIATSLRVILHDTASSKSLLTHLGAKDVRLRGTGGQSPAHSDFFFGLTNIVFDLETMQAQMVPKFDNDPFRETLLFDDWWTKQLVYLRGSMKVFRKDAVLYAANKDGGAHVDAELPKEYRDLLDGMGFSAQQKRDGRIIRAAKLNLANVAPLRQMAFEVLNSPELLALCKEA